MKCCESLALKRFKLCPSILMAVSKDTTRHRRPGPALSHCLFKYSKYSIHPGTSMCIRVHPSTSRNVHVQVHPGTSGYIQVHSSTSKNIQALQPVQISRISSILMGVSQDTGKLKCHHGQISKSEMAHTNIHKT